MKNITHRLKSIFKDLLFIKINAEGLAVFRILYSIVLLSEILHLHQYRAIIYDKIPFKELGEFHIDLLFKFWIVFVLFIAVGLFTRVATIINYIFSVLVFSSASAFEYHVFAVYISIGFLILFVPVSRVMSLDSLFQKIKHSNPGSFYIPDRKVLAVNYLGSVFLGLGLVYFDSAFFKLVSPMWLKGLGVWKPATIPMITWNDATWLLNQEWLMKLMGYLTLVFETMFIFLMWFRPFRVPLMLIGIILHIGIVFLFPIPLFGLACAAFYILMVPVSWWSIIGSFFRSAQPSYKFYYDAECPLCIKTVVLIQHFDIFNKVQCIKVQGNYQNERAFKEINEETLLINIHAVNKQNKVFVGYFAYAGLLKAMTYTWPVGVLLNMPIISTIGKKTYNYIAGNRVTERCTAETCPMPVISRPVNERQDLLIKGFNKLNITKGFWKITILSMLVFQSIVSVFSPLPRMFWESTFLKNVYFFNRTGYIYGLSVPLKIYLGITSHPVFTDWAYDHYNRAFKVEYENADGTKTIVPIFNEQGMPYGYNTGTNWCNTYRIATAAEKPEDLEKLIPYCEYFIKHNPNCSMNGKINFYRRESDIPYDWTRDFLKIQMNKPWTLYCKYDFSGKKFTVDTVIAPITGK